MQPPAVDAGQAPGVMKSLAERIDPRHCAVLVIDMQNDFCARGGYVERIVKKDPTPCALVAPQIERLAGAARAAGVPVTWLRADYRREKLPDSMRGKLAEAGIEEACCVPGTWGYQWYGVSPGADEAVVDKHTYDAFAGTDLESRLRRGNRRTLVFAGVQTNVCVEAALRHAQALGFYCVVASDCVASHTPAAHDGTLNLVRFLLGDVTTLAEIQRLWREPGATGR
ncbi:MAG: cysteine hydrolase [Burkholderiales bacterium]|nr:cysteine hydrolase [Burkholderiales bacterium]